jgi:hypothetical protein
VHIRTRTLIPKQTRPILPLTSHLPPISFYPMHVYWRRRRRGVQGPPTHAPPHLSRPISSPHLPSRMWIEWIAAVLVAATM